MAPVSAFASIDGPLTESEGHVALNGDIGQARIPRYAVALLQALRFSQVSCEPLKSLSESEWSSLLSLCDRMQLTLLFGHLCRPFLPAAVRTRIDGNYADNADRFERLKAACFEISDRLQEYAIDFALLKGFSHSPALTPDPLLRAQGDIDIWCRPDRVLDARDALVELRYRSVGKSSGRHLDPMIREVKWQWRGDYFARDLPIPVDLHYKLWDEALERIAGPSEDEMWERRRFVGIENRTISTLGVTDSLAFAALHVMMHLLHGDLRLQRVWELAYVLKTRGADHEFWAEWKTTQGVETRKTQIIAFLLSDRWFGCGIPDLLKEEVQSLPPDVLLWMKRYAFSPIEALFVPNKHELWLNLSLLNSLRDRVKVFSRRLIPVSAVEKWVSSSDEGAGRRDRQTFFQAKFLLKRARYHAQLIPATIFGGLQWWWERQQLSNDFLRFLLASVLFDFGEFIFFLLYNLYLLDRGLTEHFLGQVSAAVTTGTFVAVLPAGRITRYLGLRRAVIIAILGTASSTVLRALVGWQPALLATAFLNGLFMSFWAVSLPPAVAGLTTVSNRTLAFSLITSLGIGIGSLSGLVGGRLPSLLVRLSPTLSSVESKRVALLAGSGLAILAFIPAISLTFPALEQRRRGDKKVYPRSPFFYGFLVALFVWSLGTGAFNPFFNLYFSRHLHLSVERIGLVFSYGQMAQVFMILLAPVVMKMMGEVKSITAMQVATAAMLGVLAFTTQPLLAGITYIAYMCFQYMSGPCLFSVLMTRVTPVEQSGASAMNFLITSMAGIVASVVAGALFSRLGYDSTLAICAVVTLNAAGLFYGLVRR